MIHTFVEYMTYVKGVEYLIAVTFLAAFLTIWMLLNRERKLLLIPFTLFAIVFIAFTYMYVTSGYTVEAKVIPAEEMSVNKATYLANVKGHASFPHATHIRMLNGTCETCHHHSGDQILSCKECHSEPFKNMSKPGIKAAFHRRCIQCHEDAFRDEISGGPHSCTKCHHTGNTTSPTFTGPSRPHTLVWTNCKQCHPAGAPVRPGEEKAKIVYHENCLTCHKKGIARAAKLPADHEGRTADVCGHCHAPPQEGTP